MLDAEIIKECIEGNRIAQEKLYNFYASRMRGICLRYASSVFEAEDIFQDGVIKVFTHLKDYKNQGGSFDGWIRRIFINTAIDSFKKNKAWKDPVSFEDLVGEESIVIEFVDHLDEKQLMHLLSLLPEGYRMVFNLYAIEGYSHKEIAKMLGVTESTSKSQLFKARKQIQYLLQENVTTSNDKRNL
jgi:RNA polymerase sigma-70 factor (ECF subfamily)